tara:strand:+ start:17504 stop:17890 length:387 start_codon:yes stop_codon:yes gene_type:complete
MENNDKKYDNNNNGILFNQNNGSLEGNITLNDVKYKLRTIPIDDESADLVIHLGKVFMNSDTKVGDKRPKLRGSVYLDDKKKDFAGWSKLSKKGTEFISCQIKEPYKKEETDEYGNPKDLDDDIGNIF